MPGPISDSSPGPRDDAPYVPHWCYPKGPRMCPCGHHEGYHADSGACVLARASAIALDCRPNAARPMRTCPGDAYAPRLYMPKSPSP